MIVTVVLTRIRVDTADNDNVAHQRFGSAERNRRQIVRLRRLVVQPLVIDIADDRGAVAVSVANVVTHSVNRPTVTTNQTDDLRVVAVRNQHRLRFNVDTGRQQPAVDVVG